VGRLHRDSPRAMEVRLNALHSAAADLHEANPWQSRTDIVDAVEADGVFMIGRELHVLNRERRAERWYDVHVANQRPIAHRAKRNEDASAHVGGRSEGRRLGDDTAGALEADLRTRLRPVVPALVELDGVEQGRPHAHAEHLYRRLEQLRG